MPHLRIAPETLGSHFWVVPAGKTGALQAELIDPDDLGLSEDLLDRIDAWCDSYDAIVDPANPAESVFATPEDEVMWRAEGQMIAALIREELGDDWQIETRF